MCDRTLRLERAFDERRVGPAALARMDRGTARLLPFGHVEEGVRHLQRCKNMVPKVILQRLPRELLDDATEDADAVAVDPLRAWVEQQRTVRVRLAGAWLEVAGDGTRERVGNSRRMRE